MIRMRMMMEKTKRKIWMRMRTRKTTRMIRGIEIPTVMNTNCLVLFRK